MVMAPSLNGVPNLSPTALSGPSTSVANRPASCSTASISSAVSSPPWASAALSPAPCLSAKAMSETGARYVMLFFCRTRFQQVLPLGRLGGEKSFERDVVGVSRLDCEQLDSLLYVGFCNDRR